MTDKKNGNAFTNNPLVRAIGVQKIVVVIVLIARSVLQRGKPLIPAVFYTVKYHGLYILPGIPWNRRNLLPDYRRC